MNLSQLPTARLILPWMIIAILSAEAHAADGPVAPAAPPPTFRAYRHPVTTWVAPYAVPKSGEALRAQPAIRAALTHLALQFWVPTRTGGVERVKQKDVTDAAIADLRDWGHAGGVRVMLCLYNHVGGKWDWSIARSALADNGAALVANLVAEVERTGLDGVDIDLEGPGQFEADRPAFVAFMTELSKALHSRGKHLTVDSFTHKWNAPNAGWWAELMPLVDALTSMGYEEIGATAPDWRSYASQRQVGGSQAAKLQIGMPSGRDQWRGNTALEQVDWVRKDGTMGVAIWDAQFRANAWRTPEIWDSLGRIRSADDAPSTESQRNKEAEKQRKEGE